MDKSFYLQKNVYRNNPRHYSRQVLREQTKEQHRSEPENEDAADAVVAAAAVVEDGDGEVDENDVSIDDRLTQSSSDSGDSEDGQQEK